MPRQPRMYSNTGMYHVMIRGINKEKIFIKDFYKTKLLEIIKEISEELIFYLIAYCVMDNHLHILIKADVNELTTFMKRLNIKYAMFYNKIENRYGHVFQDRFKSEAVEDDRYLLGALRYIHNNPLKARITDNIFNYNWSSAKDYLAQDSDILSLKYLKEILDLFSNKIDFMNFHNLEDKNLYIDTKEEENENIQYIVNHVIKEFIDKYQFIDQKQVKSHQKEELAERLIKLNVCSFKEIAGLCNLSLSSVCEINKKLKEDSYENNYEM